MALLGVGALALAARARQGSAASAPSVAALRKALRGAGSTNKAVKPPSKRSLAAKRRRHGPKYARLFLAMEPKDVPDDLLIATILAGATEGDPVDAATEMLRQVGGRLGKVAGALPPGISDDLTAVGRARLVAASELYRRANYRGAARQVTTITSPDSVMRLLKSMSLGPDEVLSAIYLDARRKVIGTRVLSRGTSKFTIVDPRQVFGPAIQLGADALIMAHHHPSGDPTPSRQDYEVTERIEQAGRALGIPLLDHVVVSGSSPRFTSLAEEGRIHATASSPMVTRG
jgi:DNA repair protein RadC